LVRERSRVQISAAAPSKSTENSHLLPKITVLMSRREIHEGAPLSKVTS
jgi:hypothetical protein